MTSPCASLLHVTASCLPQLDVLTVRKTAVQIMLQPSTTQRFVSIDDLVTEIQKHLLDYRGPWFARCDQETVEHDLLALVANFRAERGMALKEFCTRLRVLIGAAVLMATVRGLQAAGASPMASSRACRKERPGVHKLGRRRIYAPY